MTKIFYACPDVPSPSGGVHTLYRHVAILRAGGFDACILHTQSFFRANWFPRMDVEIRYMAEDDGPGPADHLVIPEGMPDIMRKYAGTAVRRTVFAQNWAYVFDALGPGESWQQWGIFDAMTVSAYMKKLVKDTMGIDATVIHPGIPLPAVDSAGRKLQIAYMPRKNPHDASRIQKIFCALNPENVAIPFVPLTGLRHEAVYARLLETPFFVATGYPEGCPLPPLEAMACGCIVVGFDGMGMREYIEQGVNGYCVPDGDAVTAATILDQTVRRWQVGEAQQLAEQAIATAQRFSLENERRVVLKYWEERLSDEK
jgi:glycosyltransferase involved in cell wall biosynthesis